MEARVSLSFIVSILSIFRQRLTSAAGVGIRASLSVFSVKRHTNVKESKARHKCSKKDGHGSEFRL